MILRTLFLYTISLAFVLSIIPNHFHFADQLRKFEQIKSDISIHTAYIVQPLNHFQNSSGKFEQRYLYSEDIPLNKKVAFLYVSGPDDFNSSILENEESSIVKTAQRFGATIFALEHRFYGDSRPKMTFNSNNLRHLNSSHAVQDVIFFIEYANKKFQFESDVRWILWGAGYGGLIATEARKWDPVTVSGVIVSSAPLKREFDFWKYNDQIENAIKGAGGGLCHDSIKKGFRKIQNLMNTVEGRAHISDLFQLNATLNDRNLTNNEIQSFYLSLIAPFQQIVQFHSRFDLSIPEMCDVMIQSSPDFVQGIHQVYSYLSEKLTGSYQPMTFSYHDHVKNLKNPNEKSEFLHQRLWQYQMCTEFGWFYTTNSHEDSLFGSVVHTSLFLNQCFEIFPELYKNANATKIEGEIRNRTLSENVFGTNMILINGDLDPWKTLGMTSSNEDSVVTYNIEGGSYANDFYFGGLYKEAFDELTGIFIQNVNEWVRGPKNSLTFVDTLSPWTKPIKKTSRMDIEGRFSEFIPSQKTTQSESKSLTRKQFFGMRPISRHYHSKNSREKRSKEGFETGTFRQRIDHFDPKNSRFFQQKYFQNARFAKPEGPNFLLIGEEGRLDGEYYLLEKSQIMRRAEKYGATVYALEHRFYGDSLVENNSNLTTLSSLQMLYDLAEFINSVNYKTGTSNPWITFGGSYSGMLSAWMRELFPDLVVGAVASSAPIYAKTDFFEYQLVVENAFLRYDPECHNTIRIGFDQIQKLMLTRDGREKLSVIFELNPPFGEHVSEMDKHFFFYNVVNPFFDVVQYSGEGSTMSSTSNIGKMCHKILERTNSTIDNIAKVVTTYGDEHETPEPETNNNNYTEHIEYMKTEAITDKEFGEYYLWFWQTCTEFGFFMSLDSGKTFFGTNSPVSLDIQMCMDVFDKEFTRGKVEQFVENTNYRYGGREEYSGTNVVFTNGDTDPLSVVGLHHSKHPSVITYTIKNASHCADEVPEHSMDVPHVKYARKLVDQHIGVWLGRRETITVTEEEFTGEKKKGSDGSEISLLVVLAYILIMWY